MNKTMLSLSLAVMLSLSLGMQAQNNQHKGGGQSRGQAQSRQQSQPRQQQQHQQVQTQSRNSGHASEQMRTQQTYSRQGGQRQQSSTYIRRDSGGHAYDSRTFGRSHYSHFNQGSFVYRGGHQSVYFGGYYFWAPMYPSWFYTCNVYFELDAYNNWYGMCYDNPGLTFQVFVY